MAYNKNMPAMEDTEGARNLFACIEAGYEESVQAWRKTCNENEDLALWILMGGGIAEYVGDDERGNPVIKFIRHPAAVIYFDAIGEQPYAVN